MNQIEELTRQGLSVCGIAAVTGFDRKTVRKYLASPERQPRYKPRPKRPSQLDPFKPYIDDRLIAGVWNAVVLLRELRQLGYVGGYSTVKEYLQPKREESRPRQCAGLRLRREGKHRWTGAISARSRWRVKRISYPASLSRSAIAG